MAEQNLAKALKILGKEAKYAGKTAEEIEHLVRVEAAEQLSKEFEKRIAAAEKAAQANKARITNEHTQAALAEEQAHIDAAKEARKLLSEETDAARSAVAQSEKSKQTARETVAATHGKAPYKGTPGEEIDPTVVDVYRGGDKFTPQKKEYRLDSAGNVKDTHGLSLDTDPTAHAVASRGAKRIVRIPPELKIIQRGTRPTHFEIVPRSSMPVESYQELLIGIVVE